MSPTTAEWSSTEERIAKGAFDKAYHREIEAMMVEVKSQAAQAQNPEDLWQLHDFLSARRHSLDGKYDFRFSMLIFVFAELIREGLIDLSDLEGLSPEKIAKINALTIM